MSSVGTYVQAVDNLPNYLQLFFARPALISEKIIEFGKHVYKNIVIKGNNNCKRNRYP